jgi:restriction system protein
MNTLNINHLMLFALALIFVAVAINVFSKPYSKRHVRNIKASNRRLDKIAEIGRFGGIGAQLAYLRKVDPYIFEEMILTAIERKTHAVIRNKSYSGDGGLDGAFVLNGKKILVQAKRYKGCISTKHVQDFITLCEREGTRGIFVHTGRTPKPAFDMAIQSGVEILSGEKLISLLALGCKV